MRDLLNGKLQFASMQPNIWWGVSVENRKHGLLRIEHLREAPSHIRFLSIEPLLEDLGTFSVKGIRWVIVGGESGAGARPMAKEWVLSIRDLCKREHVPFFFKQWGGVRKSETGRTLNGRTYSEFPARSIAPVPSAEELLSIREELELA